MQLLRISEMGANFPDTPSPGDEFVTSNLKWTWDGVKWTASGGVAIFADAPEDGNLYGRVNGAWSSGGLISGDLTFRAGAYFAESAAFANGATFGSTVAAGPLDLSHHIDLFGGSYGLSITGGTLNLVANGAAAVQVQSGGTTVNGALTATSTLIGGGAVYSKSGVFYSQAPDGASNAHIGFCNPAGTVMGWVYWSYADASMLFSNLTGNGNIQIRSDGDVQIPQDLYARGYKCRQGMNGAFGANRFDAWYDASASNTQWWIDATYFGVLTLGSDYRIKRDLAPLPSMWERLKALKPISYKHRDYKDLVKANDKERWGLVAHELQETLIEDAATGVKDQEDCIQSPNPWTVIAALTKTLQEAQARIEALEGAR
jgi:hypothetical protein